MVASLEGSERTMTKKLKKALALLMALSMLTGVLGTATFEIGRAHV